MADSRITANVTAPARHYVRGSVPDDPDLVDERPICPGHQYCTCAGSYGAGVFTTGELTLLRTAVSGNVVIARVRLSDDCTVRSAARCSVSVLGPGNCKRPASYEGNRPLTCVNAGGRYWV